METADLRKPSVEKMETSDLLKLSVKKGASDLHLSTGSPPRVRINGQLLSLEGMEKLTPEESKRLIYSVMDPAQQKQFEEKLEIDFAVILSETATFRVNAFHQMLGPGAVFRVIPSVTPSLDELNLPPVFKALLSLPNGLIIVTGPTGSGKSTTLASMTDFINSQNAFHIITIEDPIEFTHKNIKSLVNQRQIHKDTKSFASALRSALREDPDVILVGEMRDLETMRLALTAAETGHLVMATLHTSSAARSVSRIVNAFPTGEKNMIRNMLSESLQAVICQKLLRKVGGGRVAAFEIMIGTPAIRNLIREDKVAQMQTTIQMSSEVGMCTLDQYLQLLLKKSLIDIDVAREAALNKELFT